MNFTLTYMHELLSTTIHTLTCALMVLSFLQKQNVPFARGDDDDDDEDDDEDAEDMEGYFLEYQCHALMPTHQN